MEWQTIEVYQEQVLETRELLRAAFLLAQALEIGTVILQANELVDSRLVADIRKDQRIIWATRDGQERPNLHNRLEDIVLRVPDAALNRLAQTNIALFLAALNGLIGPGERVLALSGVAGSRRLDTLAISKPERDYPWLQGQQLDRTVSGHLARLLEIALHLAQEGREGVPIGTTFVLGEVVSLSPYLRQLILNTLEGHAPADRNIHNPEFLETLRELAAMDGAFVVSPVGSVESAATYIDAPVGRGDLRPGLGARHAAALAITIVSDATAVVVSASSGMVSVYDHGKMVLELSSAQPIVESNDAARKSAGKPPNAKI